MTIDPTEQSVGSINVSDENTLVVPLESATALDGTVAETIEVSTANSSVQDQRNAGDHTVEMALSDDTGTAIGSVSGTFTVTQGDSPSIDSVASSFADGQGRPRLQRERERR